MHVTWAEPRQILSQMWKKSAWAEPGTNIKLNEGKKKVHESKSENHKIQEGQTGQTKV